MFQSIDGALAKSGPGMAMFTAPYMLFAYISTQIMLSVLAAVVAVILAYGAVAGTIIGLLGPIFIPFLVIEKLEFLFWGWLKAYLSFAFYKVVAAATMSVLGHLFVTYYANWTDFSNPMTLIKNFPLLILLVVVNIFLILKIPRSLPPSFLAAAAVMTRAWAQLPVPSPQQSWAKRRYANASSRDQIPEITRAAERYLEQYGDPLVMNTYLKITILVLAAVCLMLGALAFKSQKALAGMKPLVIRINDVGHADAIDYRNYEYKPQEAENKYYLSRWATLYFQRNRYTIERDQTQALYFLNSDVQQRLSIRSS